MRSLNKKANFTSFFDPSKGNTFSGFLISGDSGTGDSTVKFRVESGKVDKIKELSSGEGSNQQTAESLTISLKEVPYCDENGETGFILIMCSDPYSESVADSFSGYSGLSNTEEGSGGQSDPWDLG